MDEQAKNAFYSLEPAEILRAAEEIGVRSSGRSIALNSLENRVFLVELESEPESCVVKFYRPGRWSKEQILEEHQFLFQLANADIPVIAPMELPSGETLGRAAAGQIWFAVFPRKRGRLLDELSLQQYEQLGRLIARVHRVGRANPLVHRPGLSPETYGERALEILRSRGYWSEGMGERYEQTVIPLLAIAKQWWAETETHTVHGDFHCGNILWEHEQACILDLDDCTTGPAIQDLWLIAPGRDEVARKGKEAFIAGYEDFLPFRHEENRLVEVLRALRIMRFNGWIAERWDDPSFQKVFEDFGSDRYWVEQIAALQECYQAAQGIEL